MYTIGQVSAMTGLPISTLRYYDQQGLFPKLQREAGIRKFTDNELGALRVIECLKKSGLEIKEIKRFMAWNEQTVESYALRKQMLEAQKAAVEAEMKNLNRVHDLLMYKCWYYEQAMQYGNVESVKAMVPDQLPDDIRKAYENAYESQKSV